uniref:Secreted protein n=1 Tax=Arundo donax TaxID=35708 RepID=A0A0A9B0V6_ARUDO
METVVVVLEVVVVLAMLATRLAAVEDLEMQMVVVEAGEVMESGQLVEL